MLGIRENLECFALSFFHAGPSSLSLLGIAKNLKRAKLVKIFWRLGDLDSNQNSQDQNLESYH